MGWQTETCYSARISAEWKRILVLRLWSEATTFTETFGMVILKRDCLVKSKGTTDTTLTLWQSSNRKMSWATYRGRYHYFAVSFLNIVDRPSSVRQSLRKDTPMHDLLQGGLEIPCSYCVSSWLLCQV